MMVAVNAPTSGWATASLVFGIFGLLGGFCLLALPCVAAVMEGKFRVHDGRHLAGTFLLAQGVDLRTATQR